VTGPTAAAGAAAAGLSSLGAVFVSLEQALSHSNPNAAKPGKTNFLMVFNLPLVLECLRNNLSRFYVNRLPDARDLAYKFAKIAHMRRAGITFLLAMTALFGGQDPFANPARARVLLFVRTDCPITNRYAPELGRIAEEFAARGVEFWLVYPDASETEAALAQHKAEYKLPGTPIRDPLHALMKRAEARISPQAAVFDRAGHLTYSGRIDDRYVAFGKARSAPTTHDLEAAIAATLDGKPIKEARTRSVGCYLADLK